MAIASDYLRQAAAIPIKDNKICLVRSSNGKRWVVPKGQIDAGHSAAETALNESFQLFDEEIKSPWRGYNQALLGKVYLEWNRLTDAIEPLRRGWEETQLTWNVDLVQIVRLYYAELLMAFSGDRASQDEAERLLRTTLEESRAAAVHSAAAMAAAMLARAALVRGDVTEAVRWSSQAIEAIEARGTLPYLRNEEIYFTQYRVLREAKRVVEARQALARAHEVVQAKAMSIPDEGRRARFLSEVIMSRQIIEASRSNAAE